MLCSRNGFGVRCSEALLDDLAEGGVVDGLFDGLYLAAPAR